MRMLWIILSLSAAWRGVSGGVAAETEILGMRSRWKSGVLGEGNGGSIGWVAAMRRKYM